MWKLLRMLVVMASVSLLAAGGLVGCEADVDVDDNGNGMEMDAEVGDGDAELDVNVD